MLEEYSSVLAKRDLSDKVRKGTRGAIVMVYSKVQGVYEVEFFEGDEHLCLLTVNESDLEIAPPRTHP